MISEPVLSDLDKATDEPSMVHLTWDKGRIAVAFCGAVLTGEVRNEGPVDCVVCAEMWRQEMRA